MSIFPLDTVRNASIDRRLEPLLEDVREEVVRFEFGDAVPGTAAGILDVYDLARPRLNVLLQLLGSRRGTVGADISTGLGFLPVALQRHGLHLTATEAQPAISEFAKSQGIEVRPYTIGQHQAPFAPESLDFLVLAEVLEHLKVPAISVIRELVSLLRPGGLLVITTPNVARLAHIEALLAGENFLESFPEEIPPGADATDYVEHVREYSIREVVEAIEASGAGVDRVLMTGWGEGGYHPLPNCYLNEICVVVATK